MEPCQGSGNFIDAFSRGDIRLRRILPRAGILNPFGVSYRDFAARIFPNRKAKIANQKSEIVNPKSEGFTLTRPPAADDLSRRGRGKAAAELCTSHLALRIGFPPVLTTHNIQRATQLAFNDF
jgi:hypothetical protein